MDIRKFIPGSRQGGQEKPSKRKHEESPLPKKKPKTNSKYFSDKFEKQDSDTESLESEHSNKAPLVRPSEEVKKPPKRTAQIPKKPKPSNTKNPKQQTSSQGPLAGQTFVITGNFNNIKREELTDVLKSYGARVTGNVSSKTTCLLHGETLEDGRHYTEGNKFKKAKELGTKTMDESQLEELLSHLIQTETKQTAPQTVLQKSQFPVGSPSELWTTKYSPKTVEDIIGNSTNVEKLINWLRDWESVVLKQNKKSIKPVAKGRFDPSMNVNAKAALLSGSPGIGKTTTARLVAKGLNYNIVEMNASDVRSKKQILEPLTATSGSNSLTRSGSVVKTLLIMDEIDGMSSGDRGGTQALIQIIKDTKIPVICICNDRQSTKLKSLANYCFDIRFTKPNKVQLSKKVLEILSNEGVSAEPNAVEHIVEMSGNDIRQILTTLEMWARSSNTLTYTQVKQSAKGTSKDPVTMLTAWNAGSKLLSSFELRKLTHKERIDLFFIDYDFIPLYIHENYLSGFSDLNKLADAADSIAFSDLINKKIRTDGEWSLLPQFGQFGAVQPGLLCGKPPSFGKFPEWFGKFSTQRKNERLLRETKHYLGRLISGDNESVLNEYVPVLYKMIIKLLKENSIEEAVEVMHQYNISPEVLKEHLISLQFATHTVETEFKNIPTKTKTSLTKAYNSHYKSSLQKVKKKKAEATPKDNFDPEIEELPPGESEEEEQEVEAVPKIKKPTKKSTKKKK